MTGLFLPFLIVLVGGYLLLRLRGGILLHPIRAARILLSGDCPLGWERRKERKKENVPSRETSGNTENENKSLSMGRSFRARAKRPTSEKEGCAEKSENSKNGEKSENGENNGQRENRENDERRGKRGKRGNGAVRALMLALAGTLGVGNITGVAFGILTGGAGTVFWLFLSGIFSSVLKFAESALAKDSANGKHGGMAHLLRQTFPRRGALLGGAYALFCLLLCLTMGAAFQSATAAETAAFAVRISRFSFAFPIALLVLFFILGGVEKIEKFTLFFIPLTTILYIFLCFCIIFRHFDRLPSVFFRIFSEAFSLRSASGGVGGFLFLRAIREGFARGLLSNEAGAGTSAMAHARADTSPVREGISGALEVFFDTAILCSLTALALLVSDVPPQGNGMAYVLSVFSYELGFRVIGVLLFLIACFAFATILCWYFYGSECFRILFPGRQALFFPLFLLAVFAGPFCPPALLLSAMDAFLVLMSCLTLPVLLRNTDRLVALSRAEGLLRPKEKPPRVPPLSESPQ